MLCIIAPGLTYLMTGHLFFLPPSRISPPILTLPPLPLAAISLFSVPTSYGFLFRVHIYVRPYSICLSLTYFT